MLAFAILDYIVRGLVFLLPQIWRDRIKYNASEMQVFVVQSQKIKTKPRMTFVEAVFATILFDLALFGTDNILINFVIRRFTKFQNSWDNKFQNANEAEKEILDFCDKLQIQHEPWIWEKVITEYSSLNDFFSRRYDKLPIPIGKALSYLLLVQRYQSTRITLNLHVWSSKAAIMLWRRLDCTHEKI